jgi:hypothetical protein
MLTSTNVYQCIWACGWRRLFLSFGVLLLTAGIVVSLMFKSPRRAFAASATRLDFVVTNTNDQGGGSLRQALLDANANAGADTISFNIPQPGVQTISPTSPLPEITDPVVINAATQPGYAGTPLIELDGSQVGLSASGLKITCGSSVVRGLAINRFAESGILLQTGGNNRIEGNFIGLDPMGTIARANKGGGIVLSDSSSNLIGGTTAAERNVISGNSFIGISLSGSTNQIKGNFIGTDSAGVKRLGNGLGIEVYNISNLVSSGNIIGGTESGARNLISGNGTGIQIGGRVFPGPSGNVVQGNLIGTNAAGNAPLPNTSDGITLLVSSGTIIGGRSAGAANVIAFNGGVGVVTSQTNINAAVLRNRIFSNAGLGIDLDSDGVTPNDAGDADFGANKFQNFPLITAVTRGAQSTGIEGTLNSQPNTVFTIEIFSNSACDGSGNGEGAQFFHAFEVMTDATGAATFNLNVPLALPAGRVLTMTATDPAGNTSEFSPCQASEARGSVEFDDFFYGVLEDVGQAKITVSRVGGSLGAITVDYSTADQTATAGVDYTGISGTLTFADGETSKTLLIPIFDDGAAEPGETVALTLTADEPETLGGKSIAVLSISNNNTLLDLLVLEQNVVEGDTGTTNATITVRLSAATGRTVTVDFFTSGESALSGRDFQPTSGSLTFAPGTTTQHVNVPINGDLLNEAEEVFRLVLSNPVGAVVSTGRGITIADDDEPPAASISDVSVLEGNSGLVDAVFNVTLSAPSGEVVAIEYEMANGTATGIIDYIPQERIKFPISVAFNPGETSKTVTVQVIGDTKAEADETFFVNLRDPFPATVPSATIKDGQGIGTILNDDGTPVLVKISGRVTDESGNGIGDITIILHGSHFTTTQTDANGQFVIRDLAAGGNYTVVASKTGHFFEQGVLWFDGLYVDVGTADFLSVSPPATLEFSAASFTSDEGAGHASLLVKRAGNTSRTVAVEFSATDEPTFGAPEVPCDPTLKRQDGTLYPQGTAYARCDYATTVGTLTFAPGETTKEIHVPLVDDVHVEGDERVQVKLRNLTGAVTFVDGRADATLIITDNDTTTGAANPIFTTPFFVRMHYLDFLSREPEANEPWSAVLNNCANVFNLEAQNPSAACDRILVSQSFLGSREFRLKGFYAYTFYRVAFDQRPMYAEIIPDMSRLAGATASEVYARRAALAVNFIRRHEFKTRYDALSEADFVNALLDRYGLQQITTPDPQQPEADIKVLLTRAELINSLGGTLTMTRAQVLRAIVESDEVAAVEYNGAFVAMQYYGYLRRTPEDAGYQAWLRVITEDPSNIRVMVNGFLNSTEYRLRFGQP